MQPTDVVVITGASSGIGLATAQAFARRGAKLVLAARGAESLEDAAEECRRLGADAIAVPTDVSDEPSVERLAAAAIAEFGCIDVWVGAASVYSYGTFERTPAEVFRKIVETNLLGQVSGARAALPRFREQGSGTLILVGSVYSKVTSPYVSPYIAASSGSWASARSWDRKCGAAASGCARCCPPPWIHRSTSTPRTTRARECTRFPPWSTPAAWRGQLCDSSYDRAL